MDQVRITPFSAPNPWVWEFPALCAVKFSPSGGSFLCWLLLCLSVGDLTLWGESNKRKSLQRYAFWYMTKKKKEKEEKNPIFLLLPFWCFIFPSLTLSSFLSGCFDLQLRNSSSTAKCLDIKVSVTLKGIALFLLCVWFLWGPVRLRELRLCAALSANGWQVADAYTHTHSLTHTRARAWARTSTYALCWP